MPDDKASESASEPPRRPKPASSADLAFVEPSSRAEWRAWLEANHATSPGVWLAVGKKDGTVTTLTYDEAVEEALCFGWIDSIVNRLDRHRFKQLFTPRKPGSAWARSNKERVERLTREGRMAPAGLAAIDAAKANGSWTLLDDVEDLVVPDDLAAALDENPAASRSFAAFSGSALKMILYWVATAKRPETRAKRIAQTVSAAAEGKLPRQPE
jgi:uncharacterized protein YdeI (YjbR/CyaY-like superfamily)